MPVSRHTGTSVLFSIFLYFASFAAFAGGTFVLENDELFAYDIDDNNGELNDGSWNSFSLSDACDGCWDLRIDGDSYSSGGSFTVDPTGRELTFAVYNHISGLEVSRRVYVPQEVNFVRHLNILSNPTGSDITVELFYDTNLGSDSDTTIEATSSGDLVATSEDSWAVTDGDSNDPVVTHVWDGLFGLDQADIVLIPLGGEDDVDVTWVDVTVPAGETVIYMTLGAMSVNAEDAIAVADDLSNLALGEILFDLDGTTIAQIQNWALQDTDEDGMPDFFETLYGLDLNDPSDAGTDLDGDGLSNLEEFENGAIPTDTDTDDDGLGDGVEVNTTGTDPDESDTDGDGISDGGEVNSGGDPLTPDETLLGRITALSDSGDAWDPRAVTGGDGNTHLVWTQDSDVDFSYNGYEIYYSLLDAAGEVLIGPTRLTDNLDVDVRARVAVDSMNRAVIAWQSGAAVVRGGISAVTMVRVDPATDDQSGDAADPGTLIAVGPIAVLNNGRGHAALALDGDDNVHLAGHNPCGSPLTYAKYDIDGMELVAEATIADNFNDCHANPDIEIDADGNVHIVYTREVIAPVPARGGGGGEELYYLMLDGATGAKLIDETLLSVDDGFRAKHATVNMDADGLLHVIFGAAVSSSDSCRGGEIHRLVLDPSLDDQSGDAADPAVIRTVDATLVSEADGRHSWYSWSDLNDGEIEITWNDGLTCRDGYRDRMRFDALRAMVIDTDGNVVVPARTLTELATGGMGNRYTVLADGRPYWSQFVEGFDTIVTPVEGPVTIETATGTGTATLTVDDGQFVSVDALNIADLPVMAQSDAPRHIDFVDGLFRIVINTESPGDTVSVTLNLPTAVDADTVYFKWDAVNGWYVFPHTAGATANDVVLTLTDGGAGDADGIVNGQIVDPGGPGTNTNVAPVFDSAPVTTIVEGNAYSYTVAVSDGDAGDVLTITAPTLPAWLTFMDNGDGTATLTGTPGAANVGANPVVLMVTDNGAIPGMLSQSFTIAVQANLVPAFDSAPVTTIGEGNAYSYSVAVSDGDAGDTLTITAPTLPAWLTFMDNGDGTATLTGTPGAANVGANPVVLMVTDNGAIPAMATQTFTITVNPAAVATSVSGSGGGSGATTPWLLLIAGSLLLMRNRRTQKGAK